MTITEKFYPRISPQHFYFQAPLHNIFETTALKYSGKNAISFVGQNLTYEELNKRANQLAHWLIAKGIKVESRVGVCLRPGLEIIVALLAIQKAGGVYLPIDPDYPQERIKNIVEDAGIDLTIAEEDIIENFGEVLINPYNIQQTKVISEFRNDNPQVEIAEENTAYIFYTSGTTGVPKGIAISHKSFAYYISSAINRFAITAQDTILTIAKFSFSISLFDLMTGIVSGGQLIILPRSEIMDYGKLTTALKKATVVHLSPNLLKGLVRYIKKNYATYQEFTRLRHISSGGDIVPGELLEELKIIFPQGEIYVIYGCTEIACMGCSYLTPRNITVTKSYIGKPFEGTKIVLLDREGKKVAPGDIGEICFQGPGVMKGYLNRSELNDRVFIKVDNLTYFKTGDLGKIDLSGNLEYLGRQDFQIKLRGQRIELVEIESHLRQAPGIRDGVITAQKIGKGDKRLIAYITLENPKNFSLEAIRNYLQERLPDYMQPSGWIVLESMPLNNNLKIARKALPPITLSNLIITETYVPPRNETEKTLTTIWQNVLDIPRVGIQDNFFHIGGDSLSAMNISMLAAEEGIELSPSQIINTPTIAGLVAAGIGQYSEKNNEISGISNLPISGSLENLPPFIWRFLYERGCQTPHHWNISRILVTQKRLSFELVKKTFSYLGERHDALRLRFTNHGNCWQGEVLATSQDTIACKAIDLSHLGEQQQQAAITEVTKVCQREINLTHGPIASMVLFDLGQEKPQELFFVVHHFAMDVISWKIFWLEFELVYQQLEASNKNLLSTSPTSFKTWTQILRQYANSSAVETDIQKWLKQPWTEVCSLPKDFREEGQLNTNDSARVVSFSLSEWQTQTLIRSGTRKLDVEQILIASLTAVLSRWQNSNMVYFDRLVHGRNAGLSEFDLSRTLGCIISYAPTLLQVDRQESDGKILLDTAEQMKQLEDSATSVDLYRYLGEKSTLVNSLKELPAAEVLFNYRGKIDDILERSSIFQQTRAIAGSDHNPQGLRQYPLAIVIDIIDRQLEVRWVYSQNIHQEKTIQVLCDEFQTRLMAMEREAIQQSYF